MTPMITLDHVAFGYRDTPVLQDINLTVVPGEVIGLIGPNGAGKTTLLNLIQGLLPNPGGITVCGGVPGNPVAKQTIGAMLQGNLPLTRVKVKEMLSLLASRYPDGADPAAIMAETGLTAHANDYLTSLSGGQLRRVTYASAIVNRPRLLFLDEPTVGMDVAARQDFWASVKAMQQQGVTIVITSHYLNEIQDVADRIALLQNGRFSYVGSWDALQARQTGGTVSFRTRRPVAAFRALPGVAAMQQDGEKVTLDCTDTDAALKSLAPFFTDLDHINVTRQSLETIYLQLTKEDTHDVQSA
ncbi:ABC transporter ATP-binding protein [Schleiferilactobacillus shenzhenensis]|uniref:ABC transporter domain-containing protein n=1 Tax=Schleiferilactobacillus shenzhenensis LY-73 TaxID=1231336 RepID=U4TK58_9LACO|nr:ABC transporter ATP-binding protein [Schleiferilactobacillus shenzhenensis]ERL65236.1 hypothetical protein L248_2911 [Schleiferilactobacillus shenzhenensis LY-73]